MAPSGCSTSRSQGAAARIDPSKLRNALARIDPAQWSLPSTLEATGVHAGYRRVVLVTATYWLPPAELFRFALRQFAPIYGAWLAAIDPAGLIRTHVDAGPWHERWHVPIIAAGTFTDSGRTFEPEDGQPFEVAHWAPHSVANTTDRARVHLVIDRDCTLPRKPEPFRCLEGDFP